MKAQRGRARSRSMGRNAWSTPLDDIVYGVAEAAGRSLEPPVGRRGVCSLAKQQIEPAARVAHVVGRGSRLLGMNVRHQASQRSGSRDRHRIAAYMINRELWPWIDDLDVLGRRPPIDLGRLTNASAS